MKTTKTKAEMLQSFKRLNKVAREGKASREGYPTAAAYMAFLEKGAATEAKKGTTVVQKAAKIIKAVVSPGKKKAIPTIHIIDVLDSSASMSGSKNKAANKGINQGVYDLLQEKSVNYTYTLCDFSHDVLFPYTVVQPSVVKLPMNIPPRGNTALFDAIGTTIERVAGYVKEGEKVLVNIYTDGQENSSGRFNANQINDLIKKYSEIGWTFTFIGTSQDVDYVTKKLSVDTSNSLVYDGTGAGLELSLNATRSARTSYTASVLAGQDVSKGFYKNINNFKK